MRGKPRGTVVPWCFHPLNWEWYFLPFFYKRCSDRWSEHTLRSFCQIGDQAYWSYEAFLMNVYLFYWVVGGFYSVWSLVKLNMGRLFDFRSHDGCSEGGRAIIILQVANRDCWWDDLSSHLSFHSVGDARQGVAGRLKRPRDVLSSVLLARWVMIAREMWSGVLLGTTITGSRLDVRTKGRTCHVSIKGVPCEARVICQVST